MSELLLPLGRAAGAEAVGGKAARLSAALGAGFPVLPGWVVPAEHSRPAVSAAAAALRGGRPAGARRAVLSHQPDPVLAAALRRAAAGLGGRVIVRSSSPLEGDPRWAGAFSSVAEVGPDEVVTAVRSCWASAFAVDPLARLSGCGLPPEALELGVVIQPEIRPAAGGVARVVTSGRDGTEVEVEGTEGHPGALLSGWADGAAARVLLRDRVRARGPLPGLVGRGPVIGAARLAGGIHRLLGDDTIEWAVCEGRLWLLQALRARPVSPAPPPGWLPAHGHRLRGRPAAPGQASGSLVECRPHQRPPTDCRDAILLVDRPVPALAPLLFTARGVVARSGAAGCHLAGVARSLAVPMVTGCHPETVTGEHPPGTHWLAAIDGTTGDVALLPG